MDQGSANDRVAFHLGQLVLAILEQGGIDLATAAGPNQPRLMGWKEAAAYLGVAKSTLQKLVREGHVSEPSPIHPGSKVVKFDRHDLDKHIDSQRRATQRRTKR